MLLLVFDFLHRLVGVKDHLLADNGLLLILLGLQVHLAHFLDFSLPLDLPFSILVLHLVVIQLVLQIIIQCLFHILGNLALFKLHLFPCLLNLFHQELPSWVGNFDANSNLKK